MNVYVGCTTTLGLSRPNGGATKRIDSFHVPRSQLRSRQAPTDVVPWANPCQRWRGVPLIKQMRDHATHSHTATARRFEPGSTSKGQACSPRPILWACSRCAASQRGTHHTHRGLSVGLRAVAPARRVTLGLSWAKPSGCSRQSVQFSRTF